MKTKKKSREESNSSKSGKDAKCKVDRFVCHSHVGKPPLPKQVALLRVPPLAVVQKQELMPPLEPAPFPPHSFYAIWTFVPSPGPDQLPPAFPAPLSVCFATACPTRLRTLRPLPDMVDLRVMDV
ncbi:uncharacterized protein LOC127879578 isoform X3 [Dreissena polymorpha]|uniref:uncharacterized protein LOC127879578 isoform X3 n=1 Tax=Dreissena polymorpha TaxID=45954 RepID=UPI00226526F5|nr:uncharacterized protein LOC127879578 isoform X3 [Dreissena polymorpha]